MSRSNKAIGLLVALSVVTAVVTIRNETFVQEVPFSLDLCLRTLVTVLVPWLILPVVRFRRYAKSSTLENQDSGGMKRYRALIALLTLGMAFSFAKNLSDEMVFNAELGAVMVIAGLWLTIPLLNFLWGFGTTNKKTLRMSFVIAVYYFLWMLFYALNGSTQGQMGAEHMHIYLAPFAMVTCSPIVLYGEFCLRRFERWLALRGTPCKDGE